MAERSHEFAETFWPASWEVVPIGVNREVLKAGRNAEVTAVRHAVETEARESGYTFSYAGRHGEILYKKPAKKAVRR